MSAGIENRPSSYLVYLEFLLFYETVIKTYEQMLVILNAFVHFRSCGFSEYIMKADSEKKSK